MDDDKKIRKSHPEEEKKEAAARRNEASDEDDDVDVDVDVDDVDSHTVNVKVVDVDGPDTTGVSVASLPINKDDNQEKDDVKNMFTNNKATLADSSMEKIHEKDNGRTVIKNETNGSDIATTNTTCNSSALKMAQREILAREQDEEQDEETTISISKSIKQAQVELLRHEDQQEGATVTNTATNTRNGTNSLTNDPSFDLGILQAVPTLALDRHHHHHHASNQDTVAPGAYHVVGSEQTQRAPMQGRLMAPTTTTSSDEEEEGPLEHHTTTTTEHGSSSQQQQQQRTNAIRTVFQATLVRDRSSHRRNRHRSTHTNSAAAANDSSQGNLNLHNTNNNNPQPPQDVENLLVEAVKEEDEEATRDELSRRGMVVSMLGILILILVIVLLSLGLSGVLLDDNQNSNGVSNDNNASSLGNNISSLPPSPILNKLSPTLDRIEREGTVRFAYTIIPGLFFVNEQGEFQGFIHDMYKAVAVALGAEPVFVEMPLLEQYSAVSNGTVDVLIRGFVHTMADQVYQKDSQGPLSFSYPYGYTGIRIAGDPFFILCVENGFQHLGNCSDLKMCVGEGFRLENVIKELMPARHVVMRNETIEDTFAGLIEGSCNVILGSSSILISEENVRDAGYEGPYVFGKAIFSPDPHAAVTAVDDPHFSDFVSAVMQSIKAAQKFNINQSTASLFPPTNLFGERYKHMFQNVVGAVGNYLEIIYRNYGPDHIRLEINNINIGSTGLLLSHPLGMVEEGPDDTPVSLTTRQILKCGIVLNRPGFAIKTNASKYEGMDVDFCRGVAAALFFGDDTNVMFVELKNATQGFSQLASGELDILAGATWTLENDVREPTTGVGFSFSVPYYYGYSELEDTFCLATNQDDHQWASFVYWIVMSVIYAEENGINQTSSSRMPEIYVFGPNHKRMFRDAILGIGNYAEIYSRSLGDTIPRSGRNMLNAHPGQGPQYSIIPGFV